MNASPSTIALFLIAIVSLCCIPLNILVVRDYASLPQQCALTLVFLGAAALSLLLDSKRD